MKRARARLRALLFLAVLGAACGQGARSGPGRTPSQGELLRLSGEPAGGGQVSLLVENVSGRSLILSRGVAIEAVELLGADYAGRELSDFGVEAGFFFLIERCGERTDGCFSLEPGESIRTVPWTGYYGAPQCPQEAPSDYAAPPGQYRFVVTACSGGQRFPSPPFTVAARAEP